MGALDVLQEYKDRQGIDVNGLQGQFAGRLAQFVQDNPYGVGIKSGFRTPEHQAQLFSAAVNKYGSEDAARKWVAPPGKSNHNSGNAVDLSWEDKNATAWAHENAAKYGLAFPLSNEDWHVEPIEARGGNQSRQVPTPSVVAQNLGDAPPATDPSILARAQAGAVQPAAPALPAPGSVQSILSAARGDPATSGGLVQSILAGESPSMPTSSQFSGASKGLGMLAAGMAQKPVSTAPQITTPPPDAHAPDMSMMSLLTARLKTRQGGQNA
jgi:hypothetical protein